MGMVYCQVWLQNIVKCGKDSPVKFANFVYFCIANGRALPLCGNEITLFPASYKSTQNSQNLHYYIFDILQYFTTKLHNFTKFRKIFPTVLILFSKVGVIGIWSVIVRWLMVKIVTGGDKLGHPFYN